MYIGKLPFAQVMDHAPWKTFHRIVNRYRGDHRGKRFTCADQFRCRAFAQLTFLESLRDIQACLSGQSKSSIIWAWRRRSAVRHWPMRTNRAIDACMPSLHTR